MVISKDHKIGCDCLYCKIKAGATFGSNNPNYVNGEYSKKHFCCDCDKEIYPTCKRCKSCENKRRSKLGILGNFIAGKGRYNFKGGKPKCADCGKQLKYYSVERCDKCYRKWNFGINHPLYIDGRALKFYPCSFTKKLKYSIRKRDNFTCQCCGISEVKYKEDFKKILAIHHIDYNRENCKKSNLITLCNSCNSKANYDKDYWFAYFSYIIDIRR